MNHAQNTIDVEDLGVGLALDLPDGRLYRYRTYSQSEMVQLLTSSTIKFANAEYFNDPWDFRPRVNPRVPRDEHDRNRMIDEFRAHSRAQLPRLSDAAIEQAVQLFRLPLEAQTLYYQGRIDQLLPELRAKYPILCLSAARDVSLMWAHYAKGHQGVCLIFDAHGADMASACEVQYAAEYPTVLMPGEPQASLLLKSLLTKAEHWRYEREYRVLAREFDPTDPDGWEPLARDGIVDLGRDTLIGVILGAKMAAPDARELRAMIDADDRPLEIWQAVLGSSDYAMTFHREK